MGKTTTVELIHNVITSFIDFLVYVFLAIDNLVFDPDCEPLDSTYQFATKRLVHCELSPEEKEQAEELDFKYEHARLEILACWNYIWKLTIIIVPCVLFKIVERIFLGAIIPLLFIYFMLNRKQYKIEKEVSLMIIENQYK